MGAISDGRYKEIGGYGTGKGQVDLAKEMRKATAGQELPEVYWAKLGINAAISIFGALTQSNRLTNAGNTGAGSSEEQRTPEEIEVSINNVLSEVGCTSVNQLTEAIITEKEFIQGNNETINNFKINIDKNKGSIKTLVLSVIAFKSSSLVNLKSFSAFKLIITGFAPANNAQGS